jgi:hypothetical protein
MMITQMATKLNARSVKLVRQLDAHLPLVLFIWVAVASLVGGLRLAFPVTPHAQGLAAVGSYLPYALVVAAPVASILLALRWFPKNSLHAQPEMRFARFGRWNSLDCLSARAHPLFGATGIMASLLIGMLINVPVRTGEFMLAIPSIGGQAPGWLQMLFAATLADVAVMSSLYAIAFVMALRHVPLFPRFLVVVWTLDLAAQMWIAQTVASTEGLPPAVAASLEDLLNGNLKKALISISLWLPYLLISERVNVTYRARERARL